MVVVQPKNVWVAPPKPKKKDDEPEERTDTIIPYLPYRKPAAKPERKLTFWDTQFHKFGLDNTWFGVTLHDFEDLSTANQIFIESFTLIGSFFAAAGMVAGGIGTYFGVEYLINTLHIFG